MDDLFCSSIPEILTPPSGIFVLPHLTFFTLPTSGLSGQLSINIKCSKKKSVDRALHHFDVIFYNR